jgi:hypothetical protein
VSSTTVRNIGIVLVLAVAVFALPGGGSGADTVMALISIAFSLGIWLLLMTQYREHRMTIFALGDQYRGILYASLASILFLGAAADKWFKTGPLTVLWLLILGAAVYGLVSTFRHWRAYI